MSFTVTTAPTVPLISKNSPLGVTGSPFTSIFTSRGSNRTLYFCGSATTGATTGALDVVTTGGAVVVGTAVTVTVVGACGATVAAGGRSATYAPPAMSARAPSEMPTTMPFLPPACCAPVCDVIAMFVAPASPGRVPPPGPDWVSPEPDCASP